MSRYRIPPGVLRAEVGGKEVLLNTDSEMYHLVDASGRALLRQMDQGRSFEEAVQALVEETREPADRLASDAVAFAESVVAPGLLELVDGP